MFVKKLALKSLHSKVDLTYIIISQMRSLSTTALKNNLANEIFFDISTCFCDKPKRKGLTGSRHPQ